MIFPFQMQLLFIPELESGPCLSTLPEFEIFNRIFTPDLNPKWVFKGIFFLLYYWLIVFIP